MENKKINTRTASAFIWKLLLLTLPLLFLSFFYFISDPFGVLYKPNNFENYYDKQPYELNREYMSTEMLKANNPKYHYDSFIMGSCESFVYHAEDWKKYIHGEVFHYPAASEILYGVYLKLKYLDKQKIPINNCLLIMDNTTFMGTEPRYDYLHAAHPDLSGESEISFQMGMFKNYFSNLFCLQYVDYKITGKIKGYMKNNFAVLPGQIRITELNNEYYYQKYDDGLKADSAGFYKNKIKDFYYRDTLNKRKLFVPIIQAKQLELLKEIKAIFDRNHTNYKIVLSPMYNQLYFNDQDLTVLKSLFGEKNVFNYTGVNAYTNDIYNYYDNFHYKPTLSRKILQEIYKQN